MKIQRTQALWAAGGLALAGVTFVAGYTVGQRTSPDSSKLILETVTAVGTLGAVIVALLFGMRSVLQERAHRRGQSELAAAYIEDELIRFAEQAKQLRDELLPSLAGMNSVRQLRELEVFTNPILDSELEHMRLYYQVDPAVGVQVMRAIAQIKDVRQWRTSTWIPSKTDYRPFDQIAAQLHAQGSFKAYMSLQAACRIVEQVLDRIEFPEQALEEDKSQ